MAIARQFWFINRKAYSQLKIIIPVISGCIMLLSSILPWMVDPLKGNSSAWQLSLDIGWQVHSKALSYGLLCFICMLYAFLVAFASWKPFKGSELFANKYVTSGICCLIPVVLLLLQYLFVDMIGVDILAQHKIQVLLLQRHFGYNGPADRITINPFLFTASTVSGRLLLLTDQVSIGTILPFIAAWLLLDYKRFFTVQPYSNIKTAKWKYIWIFVAAFTIIVLGRGPIGTLCDFKASQSLSSGNYAQALNWLRLAEMFNPSLEQVASFHIERGQALYFLQPNQASDDSRVYLASVYRSQNDFLDSYQQLLAVWQGHRTTPWVVSEMSKTLESMSELTKYLNGPAVLRPDHDDTALIWLQMLIVIDPSNVYAQYNDGLIMYDLHNYSTCSTQMMITYKLSTNADIRSSAYTYVALSDIQQGQYTAARDLLFAAVQLDPSYRNNTAREALSGLH